MVSADNAWRGGFIDSYANGGWVNGGVLGASADRFAGGRERSHSFRITSTDTNTKLYLRCRHPPRLPGPSSSAGAVNGQQITIINTSGNPITFAAAGTSHVADGVSDTIAPLRAGTFRWLAAASLWYRVGTN